MDVVIWDRISKAEHSVSASLSLTCNATACQFFSSSNTTPWPVYFINNELPLRLRYTPMMLNALWLGQCKPWTDTPFTPVVQELENLFSTGFSWSVNGQCLTTKVFTCSCLLDSVAHPLLQNIKQFNGEHSMDIAFIQAVWLLKGLVMYEYIWKCQLHHTMQEYM